MALRDLVLYFARRHARLPNRASLSQMAKRHRWTQQDVLGFLHCQKQPTNQMLRELAAELGVTVEELQRILER